MIADLPEHPQWEDVPSGTPRVLCKKAPCRAMIYWVQREKRVKGESVPGTSTRVPVDCDVQGCVRPDRLTDGRGVNHFQTCEGVRRMERE